MTHKFYKLIILLLILSAFSLLMLTSCGDTPDIPEPPAEVLQPEDKITVGMTYEEVVTAMGKEGVSSDLLSNAFFWDVEDDQKICVWFTEGTTPTVIKRVRRTDITLDIGMTYKNVLDELGIEGKLFCYTSNVHAYSWNAPENKFLYVYFDVSNVPYGDLNKATMTHYLITDGFEPQESMTYDDVCQLMFGIQGTKCKWNDSVYEWDIQNGKKLYVWFYGESASTDNLTYKSHQYAEDISIKPGMTYDEISDLCNSEGRSIDISNDILKWELGDEDLYVRFDSNKIAARVIYASEIIYSGMTRAEVIDILGTPDYYGSSQLHWTLNDETEFIVQFYYTSDSNLYLESYFFVPNFKIEFGMTRDEVNAVMGSEGDLYLISSSALFNTYIWYIDGFAIKVVFDIPQFVVGAVYIEPLIQEPMDP